MVFLQKFIRLLLCGLQQEYRNLIIYKLQIIMVLRKNPDRRICFEPLAESSAEIIGLVMRIHELLHANLRKHTLAKGKLVLQRIRRFAAVSLIIRIQLSTKSIPRQIPSNRKVLRRHRADDLKQRTQKTVYTVRINAGTGMHDLLIIGFALLLGSSHQNLSRKIPVILGGKERRTVDYQKIIIHCYLSF